MTNYYDILKLSPTASADEVKKAINKELRIWSNRTNAPQIERRQEAERMVKLLGQAESTLLDSAKRAEYDRQFKSAPKDERHVDDAELTGKTDTDLIQEAWKLLIDGNVADAIYVATKATQAQGDNPEAWAILGQAKFQWGDTEDAIYEYKRAIQLKSNEASYYFDLGNIYESIEKWNDALQQYQRAAQIDPRTTMYRAAIGGLFVRHEKYREGIEILERCAQEEPANETYQWLLAVAYHDGMLTSWWRNPEDGKYYCISKEQADEAKQIVEKIKTLKFSDDDLKANIRETETLVNSMYERKFKGSWVIVVIWGLFYVIPGALWWFVNRRPLYKFNKDIHDIIEMGKKDALLGGEVGAYYSALPPGLKWVATTAPRWVVWLVILICSPFTVLYAAYDNYYHDDRNVFYGIFGGIALCFLVLFIVSYMSASKDMKTSRNVPQQQVRQAPVSRQVENSAGNDVKREIMPEQSASTSSSSSQTPFYTAITGNYKTESEARLRAQKVRAMGFEADVLFSSNWSNLRPSYWTVYSGRFTDEAGAKSRVTQLKSSGQDVYLKYTGNEVSDSPSQTKTMNDIRKFIISVTASSSSMRDDKHNIEYSPQNIIDNDPTTCWSTDLRKDPSPSIVFRFQKPMVIKGVRALPGYKKYFIVDRYIQNHKPKKILVTYDDKPIADSVSFDLVSGYDSLEWQEILLPNEIVAQSVTVKIVDTYPSQISGGRPASNDIAISELHLIGYPK